MKIRDRYGRPIENLRIILTTRCNYNCVFCHSEGYYHCLRTQQKIELNARDVELIGKVARKYGLTKVKLTGGEPLLKTDILEIVHVLKSLGFSDVSMVTNGSLLHQYAQKLKESGLDRINISLPSLKPEKYSWITGTKNVFDKVLEGIKAAKEANLDPVKINVVVLKGINEDELKDFIEFGEENGVFIQFIEYHSSDPMAPDFKKFYAPLDKLEAYLSSIARNIYTRKLHARKRYVLDSGIEVEVVRPMFNSNFCANCIRIRATPTGWKPCLLRNDNIEYINELKEGDVIGLSRKFLKAVRQRAPFFIEESEG